MAEKTHKERTLSLPVALAILGIVIVIIILGIHMNAGTTNAVLLGAIVAIVLVMVTGTKWKEIEGCMVENIKNCATTNMILLFVGILVGIWVVGGAIPSLIYYGLMFIKPVAILPLTFILCSITSLLTGTSFGSIATMGLVLYGIGVNMGVPAGLIAGAVVSGAHFGDKMSPISDTTNLAPAVSGTNLYEHIRSMMYTTVPATIISLALYMIIGLRYQGNGSSEKATQLMQVLQENYHIGILAFLPLLLVIILSVFHVPSLITLMISIVLSTFVALVTQDISFTAIMDAAVNGFHSNTGYDMIDVMLSRGGLISMIETIAITWFACMMGGAFQASGLLEVVTEKFLLKFVKTTKSLVITTLMYVYAIMAATGSQTIALILPGKTMTTSYDKMNVNRKVLSRSLEDAGTMGAALIPWTSVAAYIMGVLGCGTAYIPYSFLNYLVPVFSIVCACTKIGIWNSNGEAKWRFGKYKWNHQMSSGN